MSRSDFQSIVEQAQNMGVERCYASCSPANLRILADAARYTGKLELAEGSLLALRGREHVDPVAPIDPTAEVRLPAPGRDLDDGGAGQAEQQLVGQERRGRGRLDHRVAPGAGRRVAARVGADVALAPVGPAQHGVGPREEVRDGRGQAEAPKRGRGHGKHA